MRLSQWWTAACLVAGLALAPMVSARAPEPDLVLGLADADASGGWPVALWVIDGNKASFIVSAPRSDLGDLPGARWTPVDAQALMSLERFGAPRLRAREDADPCPATLNWGRPIEVPPNAHWPGERLDLRHADCGAGDCAHRQAWRIDLPAGSGEVLPLGSLLPGVGARGPQWLVLHVASAHPWPGLVELPELVVPPALRLTVDWGRMPVLPLAAARQFPAIHEAMLLYAARAQKLDAVSALLHVSATAAVDRLHYVRNWDAGDAQRELLGLQSALLRRGGQLTRLLLRLQPDDRPVTLSLVARKWTPDASWVSLYALVPRAETAESCRGRLAALRCEPACAERTTSLPRWTRDREAIERLQPSERGPACVQACEAQKSDLQQNLSRYLEAADTRQQRGWDWVAALTGRAAVAWQGQP